MSKPPVIYIWSLDSQRRETITKAFILLFRTPVFIMLCDSLLYININGVDAANLTAYSYHFSLSGNEGGWTLAL